jgi:rod shape-determining protein MreD
MRIATPFVLSLLLAFLSVVPIPIPGFAAVTPAMTLIAVYYWSIYRPDLLPAVAVFIIGFIQDTLFGTPLGVSSLALLGVQAVVGRQRRFFYGNAFLVEWWGFMLVAPGALVAVWALTSLYFGAWVPLRPVGFQLLLTIALYPLLTWLFGRVHQRLPRAA